MIWAPEKQKQRYRLCTQMPKCQSLVRPQSKAAEAEAAKAARGRPGELRQLTDADRARKSLRAKLSNQSRKGN